MISKPNMEIEQTYQKYLSDIRNINLSSIADVLGLENEKGTFFIPFFNTRFAVRPNGLFTGSDSQPPYDICIVLCKYLIMCPDFEPVDKEWVSYRDFKDSGPLGVYFTNEVENMICHTFSGQLDHLRAAGTKIGGVPGGIKADYDLIMTFDALPKLPMILLFNDRDDEFPAQVKLLFERRAEIFLDAECLAIVGNLLYQTLNRAVS